MSTRPPQRVTDAIESGVTEVTRRVAIYEADAETLWNPDPEGDPNFDRLIEGAVTLDFGSDERRKLDITLANGDRLLRLNPRGGFYYDKIMKVFRGVRYNSKDHPFRVAVIEYQAFDMAVSGFVAQLSGWGYDVVDMSDSVNFADFMDFDVIVSFRQQSKSTKPALLRELFAIGKCVITFGPLNDHSTVPHIQTDDYFVDGLTYGLHWREVDSPFSSLRGPDVPGGARTGTRVRTTTERGLSIAVWSGGSTFTTAKRRNRVYNPRPINSLGYSWNTSNSSPTGVDNLVENGLHFNRFSMNACPAAFWRLLQIPGDFDTINPGDNVKLTMRVRAGGDFVGQYMTGSLNRMDGTNGAGVQWIPWQMTSQWATIQREFTAVADPNGGTVLYLPVTTDQLNQDSFIDVAQVGVFVNDEFYSYFDGYSYTGGDFDYEWEGDPDNSVSYAQPTTHTTLSLSSNSQNSVWVDEHVPDWNPGTSAVMKRALDYMRDREGLNQVWESQLGEFMINTVSDQVFPNQVKVSLTDYTKKLLKDKLPQNSTFVKGTRLSTLVRAIAAGGGIKKFRLSIGDEVLASDMSYDRGTERWQIIKDACEAFQYELFFDAEGYLVARRYLDPSTSPTIHTFQTGAKGNLTDFQRSMNDSRIYNIINVYGDPPEGGEALMPFFGTAANRDPNSPTSTVRMGNRVYTFASTFFTSDQQCREWALARLAVLGLESYEVNFSSLVYPWLEVGEIVEILDPYAIATDPTRFLMDTLTIPLGLEPMSGTGKRVTYVGSSGNETTDTFVA